MQLDSVHEICMRLSFLSNNVFTTHQNEETMETFSIISTPRTIIFLIKKKEKVSKTGTYCTITESPMER